MLKSSIPEKNEFFEPGRLIVTFQNNASSRDCNNIHRLFGTEYIEEIPELNIHLVAVDPGKEKDISNKYQSSKLVRHVELNYYMFSSLRPNDPLFSKMIKTSQGLQYQWGLQMINPEPAWDIIFKFLPIVKIAIIDSGVDPNHPDLSQKIVDPINYSTNDSNDFKDQIGHGTSVAGIAAAVTNNKLGIAGTSYNTANIIPIKTGNERHTVMVVIKGIIYAIQKGAKVINMSLGLKFYSAALQSALNLAWNNGIVNVASVGNSGNEQILYPSGNNYVLGVSGTDKSNILGISNWGINVGVAAPSQDILSVTPTYPVPDSLLNYDSASGTSFAAPFVSGVAAMIFAVNPSLSNQKVIQIIQQSARPLDNIGNNYWYKIWNPINGYGLLNAGKAIRLAMNKYTYLRGHGSFYGQVINSKTGQPAGDVEVSAVKDGDTKRICRTKTNIPTSSNLGTDGIFRLMNLYMGAYSIYVDSKFIQSVEIIPWADTFLQLVI